MSARKVTQNSTGATGATLPNPGKDLYFLVRGALLGQQHKSLAAWCEEQGVAEHSARHALYGTSNSPDAQSLRARLIAAAGLGGES